MLKRRSGDRYEFSRVLEQREFENMHPEYGWLKPEDVEIESLKSRTDRINLENGTRSRWKQAQPSAS